MQLTDDIDRMIHKSHYQLTGTTSAFSKSLSRVSRYILTLFFVRPQQSHLSIVVAVCRCQVIDTVLFLFYNRNLSANEEFLGRLTRLLLISMYYLHSMSMSSLLPFSLSWGILKTAGPGV